jgi:hypothetical protein
MDSTRSKGGLSIERPLTHDDVLACVDMYYALNDHEFLCVDHAACLRNLTKKVRGKRFVRTLVSGGEIVAWIYCEPVALPYTDQMGFQQMFFASDQVGTMAYKCVVKLHEAMLEEAERLHITLALSAGSHADERFTFAKILEKNGWQRRGYLALKYI